MKTLSKGILWQLNGSLEKSLGTALARFRKKYGKDPEVIAVCRRDGHTLTSFKDINIIQDPETPLGHAWLEVGE